jgi:hypothetical protein
LTASAQHCYWRDRFRGMFASSLRPLACSVGVVVVVGLLLAGESAAHGVGWSLRLTPFLGSGVSGVSCVSADACKVVGSVRASPGHGVMGWDGKQWRLEVTPNPDPARGEGLRAYDFLRGVACTSSKLCVAVGGYAMSLSKPDGEHIVPVDRPLAERWNGVRWSLLPFPGLPTGGQAGDLAAVSCTRPIACMAVGSFDDGSDRNGGERMLAELWNGRTWSVQDMPAPERVRDPYITALSCSSSNSCIAVGSSKFGNEGPTFAELWNGRGWSAQLMPQVTAPDYPTQLSSVSCTSSRACIAVGEYSSSNGFQALAERWNGTSWTVQHTPRAHGATDYLEGVSCTSKRACMAVGSTYPDSKPGTYLDREPLVWRWDGARWSREHLPRARGADLEVVSCTSSGTCIAVGAICCISGPCFGNYHVVAARSPPARRSLRRSQQQLVQRVRREQVVAGAIGSRSQPLGALVQQLRVTTQES